MSAPIVPPSAWSNGPTCPHCADWSRGYAAGYHDGGQDGYRTGAGQGPAHPAVADSVAEMFPGWDGAEAAHRRSVERFHNERRKEVTV